MMWEQIRSNRRRSVLLITAMAVVLILLGWSAGELLVGPGFGLYGIIFAILIWAGMILAYLRGAERLLFSGMSASELQREDSPRLFNIVEEMKIASGLPFFPRIYLLPDSAPNAFAVGRTPQTSAIAVTKGLLYRLNRDELQGVIAHEVAHLQNRDTQFMTLAAVTLGATVILADLIRRGIWFGGRGYSRNLVRGVGRTHPILLVASLAIAFLGPLMAQLLYFACSRKREHLADASAVQFSRYPAGLAAGLKKISRAGAGVFFASKVTAPMFIVNPLYAAKRERTNLFATHPPIAERIRILQSMAGASLMHYETAYRRATGSGLIGKVSLGNAKPLSSRAPSDEGPIETQKSLHQLVYRMQGYLSVRCACGLESSVPPAYECNEVYCIRCGRILALPSAKERAAAAAKAAEKGLRSRRRFAMANAPPLQYTRTGQGWESFRCSCGATVQLSPSFMAPIIRCRKCGRQIDVLQT